jgi:hypothetical protein
MQNVYQNGSNGQSVDAQFLELIEDLGGRLATLSGSAIAAELAAVRALGEQLLEEVKAASSISATGLDLRNISSHKLRRAVIEQRGPIAAANFATKLSKDLAVLRGSLKLATGGEITVSRR